MNKPNYYDDCLAAGTIATEQWNRELSEAYRQATSNITSSEVEYLLSRLEQMAGAKPKTVQGLRKRFKPDDPLSVRLVHAQAVALLKAWEAKPQRKPEMPIRMQIPRKRRRIPKSVRV